MTTEVHTSPAAVALPLASIVESKTNPRTHFNQVKLDELTESILRHGVLQPILVRPKGEGYELVAGARRLRAAGAAALETIPAIVRELADRDALEIQVVENLQREDLHPLEEAEGYAQLLKVGYDVDSLALKIGKSRRYVYARMQLSSLAEVVKTAMWDGRLSHSIASLIARIPEPKLQSKALEEIVGPKGEQFHRPFSVREASEHIQRNFMLRLDEAPFDRADMSLVPSAGACTTCPLRTGNQSELFDDVKSADTCTSPSCFGSKVDAHLQVEAKKNGWKALTAAQSKKTFEFGGVKYDAEYVDENTHASLLGDYNKKYGQLVPKETPRVLGRDDRGKVHVLIAKKDLPKQKRASSSSSRSSSASGSASNSKWERDRELREALENATVEAIRGGLKKKAPAIAAFFPIFVQAMAIDRSFELDQALERLNLSPTRTKKTSTVRKPAEIITLVAKLKPAEQLALVAVLFFTTDTIGNPEDLDPVRNAFFKQIGVDGSALEKKVKAELQTKWDAADAKKKPAKKTKKAA